MAKKLNIPKYGPVIDDDEETLENKRPAELVGAPNLQFPKSVLHTLPSGMLRQTLPDTQHRVNNEVKIHHYFSSTKAASDAPPLIKKPVPLAITKMRPNIRRNPSKIIRTAQPEFKVPAIIKDTPWTTHDIIVVNKKSYIILSQIGLGGSSVVFSVLDSERSPFAIKCVDLKGSDLLIVDGYKKEIEYLKMLHGSNRVVRLFDFEYRENELFLVLESGEIDFANYILNEGKLKPHTIKYYWQQMLEAVNDIHKCGVVHSDLKPANFLLVSGNLKLIDFGIAAEVPEDKTSTFSYTGVGTIDYMSPEAITQLSYSNRICFNVSMKSDVWSLGCILYSLVYGVTPFHNFRTLKQKIYAITSTDCKIIFGESSHGLPGKLVMDVMKRCLIHDPEQRASIKELLNHPYLKMVPSIKNPQNALNKFDSGLAQMEVLIPQGSASWSSCWRNRIDI